MLYPWTFNNSIQPWYRDSSVGKEFACNAGDPSSIAGLGRSTGEGIGHPLQYSGLENSMDYLVHGVTKSQSRLSNFLFHGTKMFACAEAWNTLCI